MSCLYFSDALLDNEGASQNISSKPVQYTKYDRKYHCLTVAEWLRAWDTSTMFEAMVCGRL